MANLKIKRTLLRKTQYFLCGAIVSAGYVTSSCEKARASEENNEQAAFKYREVYLPEGIGQNASKFGLNALDIDWGIWGHNLGKVLPKDPSQNVYAKVNGVTFRNQFCFSSNQLYKYIEEYIENNFDAEETFRFAILPNDNDVVCLCEKCIITGNTAGDASPAVTEMVRRLAERFPNHIFYTSDYRTTSSLPTDSMPSNTGVLVSAINYPLSYSESPEEISFIERLRAWNATTPRILVWDYINNFDDYFTPYPTIGAMQRRLKEYKDNKVTAIFMNGSGEDISAMSHLRTAVLAKLTENPEADWKTELYEKADELYPTIGRLIADFMIEQETALQQSGLSLPLYEGVEKARLTYLPEKKFIEFHDNLLKINEKLSSPEKDYADLLARELALTRLELMRINGNLENSEKYLAELQKLVDQGYTSYNESGWSIRDYINDYHYMLNQYKDSQGKNKLKGEKLVALTPLDAGYSDLRLLTDGLLGMPSNYHNGNLIVSPEEFTRIAIPNKDGIKKLRVWLSYNPIYKITLPGKVVLLAGNKELGSRVPEYPKDMSGHSYIDFDVPIGIEGSLLLDFYKEDGGKSIAIEEIEAF